jgi:hypothetical protein
MRPLDIFFKHFVTTFYSIVVLLGECSTLHAPAWVVMHNPPPSNLRSLFTSADLILRRLLVPHSLIVWSKIVGISPQCCPSNYSNWSTPSSWIPWWTPCLSSTPLDEFRVWKPSRTWYPPAASFHVGFTKDVAKIWQGYVNVEAGPRGLRPDNTRFPEIKTDDLIQIHKMEKAFISIDKKLQSIP